MELGRFTPSGAHGLCAEMHIAATGMTTAEHAKLLGKDADKHAGPVDQLKAQVQNGGKPR